MKLNKEELILVLNNSITKINKGLVTDEIKSWHNIKRLVEEIIKVSENDDINELIKIEDEGVKECAKAMGKYLSNNHKCGKNVNGEPCFIFQVPKEISDEFMKDVIKKYAVIVE